MALPAMPVAPNTTILILLMYINRLIGDIEFLCPKVGGGATLMMLEIAPQGGLIGEVQPFGNLLEAQC